MQYSFFFKNFAGTWWRCGRSRRAAPSSASVPWPPAPPSTPPQTTSASSASDTSADRPCEHIFLIRHPLNIYNIESTQPPLLKLPYRCGRCFWPVCSSECGRTQRHKAECNVLAACARQSEDEVLLQRSAKRRGCSLSYSQAEPGRELTQPRKHVLAEPCEAWE